MAKSLNIKDPEAHRLAQAIFDSTGETLTEIVTAALRDRYEQIRLQDSDAIAADLRAISRRASAHVQKPYADHSDLLYDDSGLPK